MAQVGGLCPPVAQRARRWGWLWLSPHPQRPGRLAGASAGCCPPAGCPPEGPQGGLGHCAWLHAAAGGPTPSSSRQQCLGLHCGLPGARPARGPPQPLPPGAQRQPAGQAGPRRPAPGHARLPPLRLQRHAQLRHHQRCRQHAGYPQPQQCQQQQQQQWRCSAPGAAVALPGQHSSCHAVALPALLPGWLCCCQGSGGCQEQQQCSWQPWGWCCCCCWRPSRLCPAPAAQWLCCLEQQQWRGQRTPTSGRLWLGCPQGRSPGLYSASRPPHLPSQHPALLLHHPGQRHHWHWHPGCQHLGGQGGCGAAPGGGWPAPAQRQQPGGGGAHHSHCCLWQPGAAAAAWQPQRGPAVEGAGQRCHSWPGVAEGLWGAGGGHCALCHCAARQHCPWGAAAPACSAAGPERQQHCQWQQQ